MAAHFPGQVVEPVGHGQQRVADGDQRDRGGIVLGQRVAGPDVGVGDERAGALGVGLSAHDGTT
jgi:hypothetical protein